MCVWLVAVWWKHTPFLRTFYKQTGGFPEPTGLIGGQLFKASVLVSGAGASFRNPAPILFAVQSTVTGSIIESAVGLMSQYYGSAVFGSGYVYTPIAIAQFNSAAGITPQGSQAPVGIAALLSVVSLARSLGGYSGQIGFGPFNSGSTVHFAVYGFCAISGIMTVASTEQVIVTYLMASAPAYHEYS